MQKFFYSPVSFLGFYMVRQKYKLTYLEDYTLQSCFSQQKVKQNLNVII